MFDGKSFSTSAFATTSWLFDVLVRIPLRFLAQRFADDAMVDSVTPKLQVDAAVPDTQVSLPAVGATAVAPTPKSDVAAGEPNVDVVAPAPNFEVRS